MHPPYYLVSLHLERSKPLLIDITVDETDQAPEEHAFTNAYYLSLTTLELHAHRDPFRPSWKRFRTILRGAPALKKLVLQTSGPSLSGRHPVQLPQLTDFVLDAHHQDYAIDLLRELSMPALRVLILHFRHSDFTDFVKELVGPATSIGLSSAEERPPNFAQPP